jgi:hypothetical protein
MLENKELGKVFSPTGKAYKQKQGQALQSCIRPNMVLKPTRFRYAPAVGLALR